MIAQNNRGEPLRVLHVVEPGRDGVFRYVEGLIDFQLAQNIRVDLAYSSVRGSVGLTRLIQRVTNAGGLTLDLRVSNAPRPRDFIAFGNLLRLAKRTRPEIIHSHSSKAGVLGRSLALCGIPAKYFYSPYAYYGMDGSGNLRWLYHGAERFLGRIGKTLNISADEARFGQEVLKLSSARQEIIYNPVDIDRFSPATPGQKREARRTIGVPEEALLLGTAARLVDQKDPYTLYHALSPLLEHHPRLHFVHVGSGGKYGEEIRTLVAHSPVKNRVLFLDYLEDVRVFYQALDGFVLSSRFEAGIPFVILEALAMNLPVATTTFTGGSQLASLQLSHCWLAPVRDAEALSRAIEQLIADFPSTRPINHREIARAHFESAGCYQRILDLYRT